MKTLLTILFSQLILTTAKEDVHILVLLTDLQEDKMCYKTAIEMATDIINAHPSLLVNHRLVIHYRDTEKKVGKGLDAVFEAQRDLPPIHFVIGPVEKNIVKDVAALSSFMKVNQFSFGTSMKNIDDYHNPDYQVLHHYMAPQDFSFARVKTKLIQHFNWTRAAVINEHSFSASADHVINQWKIRNVSLITKQDYNGANMELVSQKLSNLEIKDSRIIVAEFNDHLADFMCEVYKKRLFAPRIVWILRRKFDESWEKDHVSCTPDQLRQAAEGHFTFDFLQLRRDESITASNLTASQFKSELQKRKNNAKVNLASSYAFDSLWMAASILQQTIDDPTIRNTSEHYYTDYVTAKKISTLVRNANFEGLTGSVHFENNARFFYDRENDIIIYQYRKGSYHEVGFFDSGKKEVVIHPDQENQLFIGNHVPKDIITTFKVLKPYDTTVLLAVVIVTACCILLSLFFMFVNIKYDNHSVIRMSSPSVNNVIIGGSMFCYFTVILNGLDQNVVERTFLTWVSRTSDILLALGFTFSFGGFFAKTWRVYKIFTASAKMKKVKMLSTNMFSLLAFFAVVDVLLFTSWYALADVSLAEKEISRVENMLEDSITINYYEETTLEYQSEFYAAFLGYKGLVLVFGLFLAWQTKDVTIDVLNDSKYIGLAVYNVSAISVVGVVSITALRGSNNPQLIYIVSALCIVISTVVSMLLVFLPKVLLLFNGKDPLAQTKTKFQKETTSGNAKELSSIEK